MAGPVRFPHRDSREEETEKCKNPSDETRASLKVPEREALAGRSREVLQTRLHVLGTIFETRLEVLRRRAPGRIKCPNRATDFRELKRTPLPRFQSPETHTRPPRITRPAETHPPPPRFQSAEPRREAAKQQSSSSTPRESEWTARLHQH